jgi:hypothetical protein
MTQSIASKFAAKIASFGLAATVTLSILTGLNTLAVQQSADAAQWAQQQAASAPKV